MSDWVPYALLGVAVMLFVCLFQATRLARWQRSVIAWCDDREVAMLPLVVAAQAARSGRMVSPESSFRQFFQGRMLTKDGVSNAHLLLDQHEALIAVNRELTKEIGDALGQLSTWEKKNPVPEPPRFIWPLRIPA